MERFDCNCGGIVRKAYLVAVKIDTAGPLIEAYPCMKCKKLYCPENNSQILDENGNECFLINQECIVKDNQGKTILVTQALPVPIDEDAT